MTKGNISERDFDILIKLSRIHSEKAILALKKYYVDGVIRKIDPTHVMWTRLLSEIMVFKLFLG